MPVPVFPLSRCLYPQRAREKEEKSCKDMFAFMHSLDTKVSYKCEVVLARLVLKLLAHPGSSPAKAASPTACWGMMRGLLRLRSLSEPSLFISAFLFSETLGLECWFSNSTLWDPWGFQEVPGHLEDSGRKPKILGNILRILDTNLPHFPAHTSFPVCQWSFLFVSV